MTTAKLELNVEEIDRWIKDNGKNARERLAVAAGLSSTRLYRIRKTGKLPNGESFVRISDMIGIPMERLIIRRR